MSDIEVTREDREAAMECLEGALPNREGLGMVLDSAPIAKAIAKARMEEREACCKAIEASVRLLESTNDDRIMLATVAEIRAGEHRKDA